MQGYQLALCYDSKEEHLAAGLSPEDVAELDSEETIDLLVGALAELGHRTERIRGGKRLAALLVAGGRWDMVFNIAEGLRGRSREAQVPALCELFGQPFTFSDALTCAITLDKEMAKRVVRDGGLPTPRFAVVEGVADLVDLAQVAALEPPLFAKPVAEGDSKGVLQRSLIEMHEQLPVICRELLASYGQPVLIEEYLPGRELTVGIVGNGARARVLGVMEIDFRKAAEPAGYTTVNKRVAKARLSFRLCPDARLTALADGIALSVYRLLRCRDAARVDLRCDAAGIPCFLEVNALPGMHPTHSDLPQIGSLTGVSYLELTRQILDAAMERTWGNESAPE